MAINFAKTTLQKEGIIQDGDFTYSVSFTAVNNELARLYCGITKKVVVQQPDGSGGQIPVEESQSVGYVTLEHGRQVSEIAQGENIIPHLTKFQEILDEVIGKSSEVKTTKK